MEETNAQHDGLTFEQAMTRLEELVIQLEGDEVGLEQALQCYENGVALARLCLDRLNQAELRVRELSLDSPENRA